MTLVQPSNKTLNAVDLFCASGGLSLGVKTAGGLLRKNIRSILGVDVDQRALEVYKFHNESSYTYSGSVQDLVDYQVRGKGSEAFFAYRPELTDTALSLMGDQKVHLVLAGPPCQGNSTMNVRTRHDDPRNRLYLSAVAFGIACDAETIIIENVPGVLKDLKGVVFSAHALLKQFGYEIDGAVYSAHKFGWPQTRKRYFLVATKKKLPFSLMEMSEIAKRETLGIRWAIGELELSPQHNVLYQAPTLSEENLKRIKFLQSENLRDLPLHLRPKSHRGGTTFTTVYGKLDWDQPSGTITTGFLSPGRGRYVHPTQPRCLTPIEAARLQGFPDNYFPVKLLIPEIRRMELAKWIGDAVPPILGFYVGLVALLDTE
jgi:DNA (cytosine-5)-methyltransferase 1